MKRNLVLRCTFEGEIWISTKIEKISSINSKNEFYFQRALVL